MPIAWPSALFTFPAAAPGFMLPGMSDLPRFIHLRTHTEYSLLEGALRLKPLVKTCKDKGYPAIAPPPPRLRRAADSWLPDIRRL